MTIAETFRRNLVVIRKRKRLSNAALAKRAQISQPYISLMESGNRVPSLKVIERLAKALEVRSAEFFNDRSST